MQVSSKWFRKLREIWDTLLRILQTKISKFRRMEKKQSTFLTLRGPGTAARRDPAPRPQA